MASISSDPGGTRRIQFFNVHGERKAIRLGKVSQRAAEAVRNHVEHLVGSLTTRSAPPAESSAWVASLDDKTHAKLARVGLVAARVKAESVTLGAFLKDYIGSRTDSKASTHLVYGHTRRCLEDYFTVDAPLNSITPVDAERWRAWLQTEQDLSPNTIRRRTGIAKQFCRAAIKRGLLISNPFDGLASSVHANPSRFHFVDRKTIDEVIRACPDVQWRLMVALARYGGLRTPSETLLLRWGDIDWERSRMKVTSPKTAHHPGDECRWLPIFPEVHRHLEEAFAAAPEGCEYIITRYRYAGCNLRTQFKRIIHRAGLKPWGKLWQNLRSSRETELVSEFPVHVVCAWLGNSPAVAAKHYLQVTEDHFRQAAQNPAQQVPETVGSCGKDKGRNRRVSEEKRDSGQCHHDGTWARWDSNPHVLSDKGF